MGGCGPRLPVPYSATRLSQDIDTLGVDALVHYLKQADASAEVCSPDDPRLGRVRLGPEDFVALASALDGTDDDALEGCIRIALAAKSRSEREASLARLGELYERALKRYSGHGRTFRGADPEALHRVMMDNSDQAEDAGVLATCVANIRERLSAGRYSRHADPLATAYLERVGLLGGQFRGEAVTRESVMAENDEETLLMLWRRLPDPSLSRLAAEKVVRQRLAASQPDLDVEARDAIVERVLDLGHNTVPGAELSSIRLEAGGADLALVARQDVRRGKVQLQKRHSGSEVLAWDLHAVISFRRSDDARPLGLCRRDAELDPVPCVDVTELQVTGEGTRIERSGGLTLKNSLTPRKLLGHLSRGNHIAIALSIGSAELELTLPVSVELPRPVPFAPTTPGEDGDDLEINLEFISGYAALAVSNARGSWMAILPPGDISTFFVSSQGAKGQTGPSGWDGRPGRAGRAGRDGSCPSRTGTSGDRGRDGTDGGPGGRGGPGGDGGDVRLRLHCGDACDEATNTWHHLARSMRGEGGDGGPGGAGGRGGDGGAGGRGPTCTTSNGTTLTLQAGQRGDSGRDGRDGKRGRSGRAGAAGKVSHDIVRDHFFTDL